VRQVAGREQMAAFRNGSAAWTTWEEGGHRPYEHWYITFVEPTENWYLEPAEEEQE
jgi:hypothetical protein